MSMSKFICLCGDTFKTQKIADLHMKIRENSSESWRHGIFKQHWQARFATWFWQVDITYYLAFFAGVTINGIVMSHLHWGDCATITEAVCMGLLLPRLLGGVGK